jgi:hypothetical protein
MRLHYCCDNCGSEIILQDSVWLGDHDDACPICGDDSGAFTELIPEKWRKKRMNNLNSVLIEGTVSGSLNVVREQGVARCSFVLSSLRYLWEGKTIQKQETRVWITLRNTKLVDGAIAKICGGRGVRVVGRLALDEEDNGLYIEAEHIEYRPEPGDKE